MFYILRPPCNAMLTRNRAASCYTGECWVAQVALFLSPECCRTGRSPIQACKAFSGIAVVGRLLAGIFDSLRKTLSFVIDLVQQTD